MAYTIFNQKFDNAMIKGLSWFGINLVIGFQDITQNMICNLAKNSHDLEICQFNLLLSYIDDTLSVYCAMSY